MCKHAPTIPQLPFLDQVGIQVRKLPAREAALFEGLDDAGPASLGARAGGLSMSRPETRFIRGF
jgi:hypothetical protein